MADSKWDTLYPPDDVIRLRVTEDGGGSEDGGKVLDLRAGTTHVDGLKYLEGKDVKPMTATEVMLKREEFIERKTREWHKRAQETRERNRRIIKHALSGRRVTIFQPTNQRGNTMSEDQTDCEAVTPSPGASRGEVRAAVDGERAYQDELAAEGGRHENCGRLTVGEEILLLTRYMDKATKAWELDFNPPEVAALVYVRKIAAIAQRCMENNGAPRREGY